MGTDGYTGISLPKELIDEIEKIVKNKKYGYSSKTEFVKEAIRMMIYMRDYELARKR